MKTLSINLILVIFLVVGSVYPSIAQTPEQIYQKGLMKEEGEGVLMDAIDFYNQVADNSNADESLQAKSLLRIGMCYEKLGKDEATKAYQRLVNNFPGEKQEVAIARERLSKLLITNKITQKETKGLIIRKVLSDAPSEPLGAPSPDGRYISFVDWSFNSNLSILDLETKKRQNLTDFKDSNKQAYYSSWSPDGKKIAYFWWDKNGYNISIVDLRESKFKDLLKSENVNWIELGNWSSDGKYIVATLSLSKKTESQIVRISTTDGSVQILKKYEDSYLGGKPWFSPDGRYIAYDLPDDKASGNSDIHILSIENKIDNPLFKHPAHDYFLGWTPDGKNILFASDRTGTVDAMIIPIEEGRSIGQPMKVQANIGPIIPMGFTQTGSYFYGDWPGEQDVYSAEIDFTNGKVVAKPELAVRQFEGRNGSPYYSNDGKFIAYISKRGILRKGMPGTVLCIREIKIGKEIEINPPYDISNSISHPTWSPDDKSIALMFRIKNGRQIIYNYNIQSKEFSPLVVDNNGQVNDADYIYPQWSKDGKTLYYFQLSQSDQTSYIKARNIETGNDKVLFQYSSEDFMDRIFTIALSPDGKWISAINRAENRILRLISTEREEVRDLYNFKFSGGSSSPQTWSKDGKYIIYAYWQGDGGKWDLKRIAVDNSEILDIKINMVGINSPNLHPDGRQLIFSSIGNSRPENTIWVMENFLPLEKLAQKEEVKEPEGIRIRQISKEPYLGDLGTVSSDGKYLSCVDWGKGDLAIRNILNGEKQLLMDNASLEEDPQKFVIGSAISKNGKLVAYSWWRPYHTFDLHIFDIEKNTSNLLFKEKGVEVYPLAWLSDDKLIAIKQNRNEETTQITLFNVSDGTFQNLKSLDKRQWAQLCTSPDEEYIAYNTIGGGNSDINLLTADGKSELSLVAHPANDKVIGWIPSRKDFLFTSDRSGTWDLWTLPVMNGKPVGEAKRLFTEFGDVAPIGITEKGDCFFGFSRRNFNAYITSVDKTTGKPDQKPTEVLAGSVFSNSWSPNGEYMACVKQKKSSFELILQETNNGNERRLAKELVFAMAPHWSSDGNSIYIFGMDQEMRQTKGYKGAIYTVDVETGDIRENLQISEYKYTPSVDDALPISGHVVSDDNKYIYLLFQNDWIVKRNLANGTDTILYRHPGFVRGVLQLSPDGKKLLFAVHDNAKKQSRLITISVNGGDERELCTSQDAKISGSAFWSPDGKFIYFSERLEGTKLWRVKAEGGKPEKVWHTNKRAESFSMHPLGKEISYTVRERTTEIRVIEGLAKEIDKVYSQNE